METRTAIVMAAGLLSLGACATPHTGIGLDGHRTVFHNPYAPVELENGPVGPEQCQNCPGGVWVDGLFYPGRGWDAYDRLGNRVRLSRSERRTARERFRLIRDQAALNQAVAEFNAAQAAAAPPPPIPSAPPVASLPASSGSSGTSGGVVPTQTGAPTSKNGREPF